MIFMLMFRPVVFFIALSSPSLNKKSCHWQVGSLTTSGKALRSRGSDSGRWWWGPRSASGGQAASSPGQAADSVHTVSHPPAPPQSHRAPHIARPPGIVTPRFPPKSPKPM